MENRVRDWIVGSICTAKALISILIGISSLFSISDDGMRDVVEKLVITAALLLGVGPANIRVLFGWLVDKEAIEMRNRRMTAWTSEMICGGALFFLMMYAPSKKDFDVGHGQEYILIYPVMGVLMLLLAQTNIISFGVERSESRKPGLHPGLPDRQ